MLVFANLQMDSWRWGLKHKPIAMPNEDQFVLEPNHDDRILRYFNNLKAMKLMSVPIELWICENTIRIQDCFNLAV